MKFAYILSGNLEVIEFSKTNSERYHLLKDQIIFEENKPNILFSISFNSFNIENLINRLLIEREVNWWDIPDYKGRFREDEIFVEKEFNGEKFKLCNTGFDSKIIFFINIYNSNNSISKMERPNYLIFVNNIREFREFLEKRN